MSEATPALEVEGLQSLYPGGAGLKEASFQVEAGTIVAIVGPNGAGKTTLLEALTGHRRHQGRVKAFGIPQENETAFQAKIAYLPEARGFPPFITGRTSARLAGDLWDQPGLYPRFLDETLRWDLGDAELDRPARLLSQGTREKLALALVFSRQAPLYLLDEPEAHLDPIMRKVLEDRLLELRQARKTVVFSTHDVYLAARLGDRILLVKNGLVRPAKTRSPEAILAELTEEESDGNDR